MREREKLIKDFKSFTRNHEIVAKLIKLRVMKLRVLEQQQNQQQQQQL